MKSSRSSPPSRKKDARGKGRTPGKHPHVVVSGYYGFDNLGDELILRVLTDGLKGRHVRITVLSQNPRKTAKEYGVEAISRTSFVDIVDALARANLFISGGGGLFQDATGPMSVCYYGGLIHLARFFEVPVCFWAQGVGPLKSPLARWLTAIAMRRCASVIVRDEASARLVEDLTGQPPEVAADPVWLLNVRKKKQPPRRVSGRKPFKAVIPWKIGLSIRPWPQLTGNRLKALADCLRELAGTSERPVRFLLFPFQVQEDTHLLESFARRLKDIPRTETVLVKPTDILTHIGECDLMLGMRFHSLILALLQGVPVYGLPYDPKVASLLDMFQLQGTPVNALETLNAEKVRDALAHYPHLDLKPLKQQARRNFKVLSGLLEIPEADLLL